MLELIKNENGTLAVENGDKNLLEITEVMLTDIRSIAVDKPVKSVPIASLEALGGSAASLLPKLRTVTETISFNTQGLYTLANESVGDVLKQAKDGTFWGALETLKKCRNRFFLSWRLRRNLK